MKVYILKKIDTINYIAYGLFVYKNKKDAEKEKIILEEEDKDNDEEGYYNYKIVETELK